mmetsp:Transcript_20549/g.44940  ORF Transcript_20549/g.44940 Transcript_20549/m.44940 type:complete len:250 (-) Transcript_20549:168-917(-)|eukprot:CAMPEP_0118924992 /NCGR_PEP_ID=MMETSP1169-20130426/2922_1 /TAXON_ID=36882 /ORGANISM="Pyramimonas obovata, Strain CCMP722" /LENGTH=249 /DNA_ID=CAMNT_0006866163 /DNA_START=76 /DNA_END=825 /DNA_ORIENTATION=-
MTAGALGVVLLGLAVVIRPSDARPSVDDLRAPLYKGVRCAACMAVCNETKHILDDLDKKHYSTKTTDRFGGHYDSTFHTKMIDDLEKLCHINSPTLRESDMSRKYALTKTGVDDLSHAFDTAYKESREYVQDMEKDDDDDDDDDGEASVNRGMTKIDRGPFNRVADGIRMMTADPAEMWTLDVTQHDHDWRQYSKNQLSIICAMVTESDEFEDMLEAKSWAKWTGKKQRKLCEDLHICPKLLKQHKTEL